jgi:uncharacterized repeat protein (TIGR01451 family)
VRWQLGDLPRGAQRSVEYTLRAQSSAEVSIQAAASAGGGVKESREMRIRFEGVPALSLQIAQQSPQVEVGKPVDYIIRVRNQGSETATHVKLVATVPEQMHILEIQPPKQTVEITKVVFEPVNVEPGKDVRFTIKAKGLREGEGRFQVEMTADQLTGGVVHREEMTMIVN